MDLQKQCVVEIPIDQKYVALSYVWGSVQTVHLLKANMSRLMSEGSLDHYKSLLPQTIQDAMQLVELMKQRYLWVDSLCLIQDDPEDIGLGTQVMDIIYELSDLTIIAAGGVDASAGLVGLHESSRTPTHVVREIGPGVTLAFAGLEDKNDPESHFKASRHNTRG
jgi:hypothetical protein